MNSNAIIKIEGISKKYTLGSKEPYYSLRDSFVNVFKKKKPKEEFWALKDIIFDVEQGETIGIIGRNGAGKSTLLKILSRITPPTRGKITMHGRVASLLEVGTGFNPELTGRENIYLNGAILGMTKKEISRKFDEIVTFSEIEKFLDTPVKRYSSGMYVRLAFAVAAHLEPEILIVDEVLAVGDAQFQKKCLGKMGEVAKGGRTVLFVSHNMGAIRRLCSRSILLNSGKVVADGKSDDVINQYLQSHDTSENSTALKRNIENLPKSDVFEFESVNLFQNNIQLQQFLVENGSELEIEIKYKVLKETKGLRLYIDVCDNDENILLRSLHDEDLETIPTTNKGEYISRAFIPADFLAPMQYELKIQASIFDKGPCFPYPALEIPIQVEDTGRYNRAYRSIDKPRGKFVKMLGWNTKKV
jgi:lipopolysaccharide transport system ATP-binding protein